MDADQNLSNASLLPLALALLAVVLGGAGLYFGLTANSKLQPIVETIDARENSFSESVEAQASIKESIKAISEQNKELAKAITRLRAYGNERDQTLKELQVKLDQQTQSSAKSSSGGTANQSSSVATNSAVSGEYVIRSGDTFARIALESGIKLQDLLNANPGVDPRRLRIGQTIMIPTD